MKKTKKSIGKEPLISKPAGLVPMPPVSPKPTPCDAIRNELDLWLAAQKDLKSFQLKPCGEGTDDSACGCSSHGGGGGASKVDLIVLIDTSSSMYSAARAVSAAASAAIEAATKNCPADLRIQWLGVDTRQPGTGSMPTGWPSGTPFLQTHEQYLASVGHPGPYFHDDPPFSSWPHEQGADAIADLSGHFDWRNGACRSIFYISDTNLDALGHDAGEIWSISNAITVATGNNVTVFAHYLGTPGTVTAADYINLCSSTGGMAEIGGAPTQALYERLLENAICNACGNHCQTVEFPEIKPCISVAWGDSDCDCLETDDYEVLYVTVCNCFSNVTFGQFSIAKLIVTNDDGSPVAILPDGTDSVEVRPRGPICFGDIGPCVDGKPTCKSREFVLYTRGAKKGKYKLKFEGICFQIVYGASTESCFEFELCYS